MFVSKFYEEPQITMSIYVKNAINMVRDDDGWSNDSVNLLEGLLEYPNLTLQDLEYILDNISWMHAYTCIRSKIATIFFIP